MDHDDLDHDALNGVPSAEVPKEGESILNGMCLKSFVLYILRVVVNVLI